jgi:hypothetical protein
LIANLFVFNFCRTDSILDKVAGFHNKKPSEIFEVALKYKNDQKTYCDSRFYFYTNESFYGHGGSKGKASNFIITSNYYNPEATNDMFVQLLSSNQCPKEMEMLGFVGQMTSDETLTVSNITLYQHKISI